MTSPRPPARYPDSLDATRRAPVVVNGKPGRLVSVGGDRRTPNGRCRVQLSSGAWLTPRIEEVELAG